MLAVQSGCATAIRRSFFRADDGSVMFLVALSAFVLFGFAGLAVDYARQQNTETRLQDVTDAATLAGARSFSRNRDEAKAKAAAEAFFQQAVTAQKSINGAALTTTVDPKTNELKGSTQLAVPTMLARLMGVNSLMANVTSTAGLSVGEIEVAIMVDLSSSMTGTRFNDTKAALRDFTDNTMREEASDNPFRVALAPFASAVNPGPYFSAVADPSATGGPCVGERLGSGVYSDDMPGSGDYLRVFQPASGWPCLTTQILPLEERKSVVQQRISQLQLSEGTAGHLGTAWAWYLVSPKWADIWPSKSKPKPYGDTTKIVILMTDGENFPKDLSPDSAADTYARNVCTAMKNAGVVVYAIGFHVEVSRAKQLLEDCASSPDKHYFPSGGTELRDAFREISSSLTKLRLVN